MITSRALSSFAPPIYAQIRDHLREKIVCGQIGVDAPLPSERSLCAEFEVSRGPVRQALRELEQEGLIYHRDRVGYFAQPARVTYQLHQPVSFSEKLGAHGMSPGAQVLAQAIETPSRPVREMLGLSVGDPVLRIKRLRSADGQPLLIETLFLDARRFAGLATRELNHRSIWGILREEYAVRPGSTSFHLKIARLDAEEAALLGVAAGDPAVDLVRLVCDPAGRPFELVQEIYRADRAEFRITTNLAAEDWFHELPPER